MGSFYSSFVKKHRVKDCWINKERALITGQSEDLLAMLGESKAVAAAAQTSLPSLSTDERKRLVHEYLTGVHGKSLTKNGSTWSLHAGHG